MFEKIRIHPRNVGMSSFKSVLYQASPPSLQVLDQLKLPNEKEYIDVPNIQTAHSVIHKMQIRGAPLIAIVAVLGLAVDLQSESSKRDLPVCKKCMGPTGRGMPFTLTCMVRWTTWPFSHISASSTSVSSFARIIPPPSLFRKRENRQHTPEPNRNRHPLELAAQELSDANQSLTWLQGTPKKLQRRWVHASSCGKKNASFALCSPSKNAFVRIAIG